MKHSYTILSETVLNFRKWYLIRILPTKKTNTQVIFFFRDDSCFRHFVKIMKICSGTYSTYHERLWEIENEYEDKRLENIQTLRYCTRILEHYLYQYMTTIYILQYIVPVYWHTICLQYIVTIPVNNTSSCGSWLDLGQYIVQYSVTQPWLSPTGVEHILLAQIMCVMSQEILDQALLF